MGLLLVRIVSAVLHIIATGSAEGSPLQAGDADFSAEPPQQPVAYWRVCLLMLGRFAHGVSVASYIVAFVWIGSFISSNARKASMIATANTIMLVGSVVGPQMGVAMEFVSPYVNPIVARRGSQAVARVWPDSQGSSSAVWRRSHPRPHTSLRLHRVPRQARPPMLTDPPAPPPSGSPTTAATCPPSSPASSARRSSSSSTFSSTTTDYGRATPSRARCPSSTHTRGSSSS